MGADEHGIARILAGFLFLGLAGWLFGQAVKSDSPEAGAIHRLGGLFSLWASASFLLTGFEVL